MNIDLIEEKVMWAISNCIFFKYGNIGYFVELNDDSKKFNVGIYDIKCREVNRLTDEEKKEHLLNDITIDFKHIEDNNNNLKILDLEIIDYVTTEIEKILYEEKREGI